MERARDTGGTFLVVLHGESTDAGMVRLACQLARERGATLRALYVVAVPPSQPLGAWHGVADERGREALAAATEVARAAGCTLRGAVLPARDVGQAVVDEAAEWAVDLVVLALGARPRQQQAVWHVVEQAVCPVLVWRPAPDGADLAAGPAAPASDAAPGAERRGPQRL
jgi:K+-sensing histidine kinase KdpD